jgi:hypothetical protein
MRQPEPQKSKNADTSSTRPYSDFPAVYKELLSTENPAFAVFRQYYAKPHVVLDMFYFTSNSAATSSF